MTNEERVELIHQEANNLYKLITRYEPLNLCYIMPTMSFLTFEKLIDRQAHSIVDWKETTFNKYSIWAGHPPVIPVGLTVPWGGSVLRRQVYIGRLSSITPFFSYYREYYMLALDPSIPLGKVKINVWSTKKNNFIYSANP